MPTRSLRILIVEDDDLQRLNVEKMLNYCGYHRVAPLSSLQDFLKIIEHAVEPFDLLVINSALVKGSDIDLEAFCRKCPYIRHALIYEGHPALNFSAEERGVSGIINKVNGVPDADALKVFMSAIDPEAAPRRRVVFGNNKHRIR